MWQKERLLNIGTQALPDECDKLPARRGSDLRESRLVAQAARLLDNFPGGPAFFRGYPLPQGAITPTMVANRGKVSRRSMPGAPQRRLAPTSSVMDIPALPGPRAAMAFVPWTLRRLHRRKRGSHDAHASLATRPVVV